MKNSTPVRTVFRVVAFAEAASWVLLLTAMFFKWILDAEPFGLAEGGVPVAGPIHGGIFVAYLIASVVAAAAFKWNTKTLLLAIVSSVPPFLTAWFEIRADSAGLLQRADTSAASAADNRR